MKSQSEQRTVQSEAVVPAHAREQCGVFVANCVEFMREMPANSVNLTVTSPPYDDLRKYNGYQFDFAGVAE